MTKREIRDALLRAASDWDGPWRIDARPFVYLVKNWVCGDGNLITMKRADLQTFYLLVAEAL